MTTKPQYRIEKVSVCEKCQGAKVVQNPAWVAFYAAHPAPTYGGDLTDKQLRAWFVENGWEINELLEEYGLPHEEIACPDCEGEGRIVEFIDLRQALREVIEEGETHHIGLIAEMSLALDLASRLNVGEKNINPPEPAKAWGNPSGFQEKINELLEFTGRKAVTINEAKQEEPLRDDEFNSWHDEPGNF